jgi:hypothetical protein
VEGGSDRGFGPTGKWLSGGEGHPRAPPPILPALFYRLARLRQVQEESDGLQVGLDQRSLLGAQVVPTEDLGQGSSLSFTEADLGGREAVSLDTGDGEGLVNQPGGRTAQDQPNPVVRVVGATQNLVVGARANEEPTTERRTSRNEVVPEVAEPLVSFGHRGSSLVAKDHDLESGRGADW